MKNRYTLPILLLVFVSLAAGIVGAGCLLYRSQQDSCRTEAEHDLAAIADLKVSDLSMWRKDRLADANVFYKNNAFSALVRRCIERPQDLPVQEELRTWIGHLQASNQYDRVALLDDKGDRLMTVSDTREPLSVLTRQEARDVVRSGQLTFADFDRNDHTGKVFLRLFVPILDGQAGGRPLGVLMLRIDPELYLYPFLQRWPTPSETAETLLVHREGNEAVFLNKLKFRKNTALALRVSLDSTDCPAVKAALGQEGIVAGVDYRGVPVLAAMRAVPDSPWFLVARMDAAEVYAPMRERLWLVVLFVGALLFGMAAVVGFLWRQQHLSLYREKYEVQRKHQSLFESSRDALMIMEPPSWKFTAGNPAAAEMFRVKSAPELVALGPWDLSPERQPDGRASGEKVQELIRTTLREGSHFFEWTCQRMDGEEFPITVLLTRVEQVGKVIVQAAIRDITEQKCREEALQKVLVETERVNRLMQSRETRIAALKQEVNALLVELGRGPAYRKEEEPPFSGVAVQVSATPCVSNTVCHGEASGKGAAPPAAIHYPIRDLGLEKPQVDVTFIPILCAAPLLYAKTHGYFAQNGLDVKLTPAPGWSGVKDLLAFGHTDAAHLLSPMPLAVRQGLDGRRAEIRLACIQNVNGQALTLAKKHAGVGDVREMKGFTFGVPYRFSMHYYLLCLFLAEHGLDPLRDVTIIEISPPRMPHFLETGRVDGVFAPEPFNQIPVYRGTGFIYTLSKEIWHGHPCCCLASTEEFIHNYPKTYQAMLRSVLEAELALHRALPDERREVAAELSQPGILNQLDPEPVAQALSGEYDDGRGRQCIDHDRIDFLPTPWPEYGGWILSQQQRWKQLGHRVDYRAVVEGCFDAGTREIAKALGFEEPGPNLDGIKNFRVTDPFGYMRSQPFCAFAERGETDLPSIEKRIARLSGLLATAAGGCGSPNIEAQADDAFGGLEQLAGDLLKNIQFAQDALQEQKETLERTVKERLTEIDQNRRNAISIAEDAEAARKIAEASRAQYEQVVSMISDVVWRYETDGQGQCVASYISPAVDRLLGLPVGTIGNSVTKYCSYVCPEDLPSLQQMLFTESIALAKEVTAEYRLYRPDGMMRWGRTTVVAYLEPDGHIASFGTTTDITDRKREEERAKQEEARVNNLLELSQMTDCSAAEITNHALESAIRLTGSTIGYIAFANEDETVLTMHYWSNSAMQPCAMVDKPIVHRVDDTGLWGEAIRQRKPVITNNYAAPGPLKNGTPPGHVRLDRHMNVPVFDGGRIVAVVGVGNKPTDYDERDVRQLQLLMDGWWRILSRQRAEEALQRSEAKFRGIAERSLDALFITDLDGIITYYSPSVETILQYKPEEMVGRHFSAFLPEDEALQVSQSLLKHMKRRRRELFEATVVKKDGSPAVIELSIAYIVEHKKIIGGQGILRDITGRKNAEEALRKSEGKFRGIAERSLDAIFITDMHGAITYISPAVEKMLLYGAGEMIGRMFSSFLPPDEALRTTQALVAHLRHRRSDLFKTPVIKKDGSLAIVEISAAYVRENGKIVGAQGIVRDVTERELVQKSLQQAKEAAEAANRAKSAFLANMSHEIRTPMTAILGFTELLMSPNVSEQEHREYLETIRKNGSALLELIGSILDLSKVEAERLSLEFVECRPHDLVQDVLATAQVRAREKGLSLAVHYDFPLPETIRTDPIRLRQILMNLVGNAIKFTDRGTVRISVGCLPQSDGSLQMRFVVSDSGIGIRPEKLSDLFQPFMQVDSSAARRYGGTGLGLAISKRLATMLGGDIHVASKSGQGSTFTLILHVDPLAGVRMLNTLPDIVQAEKVPMVENVEAPFHARVLLAEDAPDIQRVICHLLKKMNLDVEVAENGRVACEKAVQSMTEGHAFDVILTDIQMPEMDGYEAVRWLRAHGWREPVIALTAHAMAGDREKCLAAGCDDYITKPVTMADLRRVLTQYLRPCLVG